jgi:hypothetical protein
MQLNEQVFEDIEKLTLLRQLEISRYLLRDGEGNTIHISYRIRATRITTVPIHGKFYKAKKKKKTRSDESIIQMKYWTSETQRLSVQHVTCMGGVWDTKWRYTRPIRPRNSAWNKANALPNQYREKRKTTTTTTTTTTTLLYFCIVSENLK